MPERCTRFLSDSNLFISATKRGWTRSSELLSCLLDGPFELFANEALLGEYEKYAVELGVESIFRYMKRRLIMIYPSAEEVSTCKPFFPQSQRADIVHAATCLHCNAVLISNDRHFEKIREAGMVEVWTISEAIERLL